MRERLRQCFVWLLLVTLGLQFAARAIEPVMPLLMAIGFVVLLFGWALKRH